MMTSVSNGPLYGYGQASSDFKMELLFIIVISSSGMSG
jgi:hypothetical protein